MDAAGDTRVGYYPIKAESQEEAVELAKQNPAFAWALQASIEFRPIKVKKTHTDFVCPK